MVIGCLTELENCKRVYVMKYIGFMNREEDDEVII